MMDADITDRPFVVLTGGSGVRHFGVAIAKQFSPVIFLVNAYDDGKSTGLIREYFGSLGPSDPAKLIAMLVQVHEISALTQLWHMRITVERKFLRNALLDTINNLGLPHLLADEHRKTIDAFLEWVIQEESGKTQTFDSRDLALRNVILMGSVYLQGGLQQGIDHLVKLLYLPAEIVVVSEEIACLVGILENGRILKTEAEISTRLSDSAIWRVHITRRPLSLEEIATLERYGNPETISREIEKRFSCHIEASQRAKTSILQARGVLYAPGTLFSSIIPTAMLLASELSAIHVPRIFMANLVQECEPLTIAQMVRAFWHNIMHKTEHEPVSRQQMETIISQVLVEKKYLNLDDHIICPGYPLPIAYEELSALANIEAHPLEDTAHPGVHASDKVLAALQHILNIPGSDSAHD
jgi:2-phospho-L-lactate transferase/gluconeogenesis factor (CofD/UPF0052 family)